MGTVLLKCFVGGVAGILVWLIFEAQAPHDFFDPRWNAFEMNYVCWLGLTIGASIGGLSGWLQGGKKHLLRGLVFGGIFGAMGILFGHQFGSILFHLISPTGGLITNIVGRTISFGLMGACLGLAIGGSTFNAKRATQGLIGGLLAGMAGGALFDLVSTLSAPLVQHVRSDTGNGQSEVGIVGRAFMALILGAVIGLFIGLVERMSRSAWVRLVLGRNEGREWSIDGAITTIGRSEGATIPLFGDANVGPIHAEIQRRDAQTYLLVDHGTPQGTWVNGQRIQAVPLLPGSQIQIGNFKLEFLMKNGPSPSRSAEILRSQMSYPPQGGGPPDGSPSPGPYGQAPAAPTGPAPGSLYSATSGAPQQTMANPAMGVSNQTVAYGAPAPSMQGGALTLVALDGPLAGQRFPVSTTVTLGRESTQVPMGYDQQASRRHADVFPGQGILNVQDNGSTNGTFVNGQRIGTAQARPGDVLKVGGTSFRVEA
jgi:pSer/pThr/pTyr-binding forkhead associated (FHA) protein